MQDFKKVNKSVIDKNIAKMMFYKCL